MKGKNPSEPQTCATSRSCCKGPNSAQKTAPVENHQACQQPMEITKGGQISITRSLEPLYSHVIHMKSLATPQYANMNFISRFDIPGNRRQGQKLAPLNVD